MILRFHDSFLFTTNAQGSQYALLKEVKAEGNNPMQDSSTESGFYKYKSVP